MRGNASQVLVALTIGAAALLASGCSGGGNGGDKTTACNNLKQYIADFGKDQSDPKQVAQAYSDMAKKFRDESKNVGDDKVKSAATKAATALDGLSADMRSLAAGNVKVPNTQALQSSFAELRKACGTP
jgi:hypothetical protein